MTKNIDTMRSTPTLSNTLEFVTPRMAKHYLESQHQNRSLSEATVAKYCATMLAGDWRITQQGIAFHINGSLCDGQHRMEALSRLEGKLNGLWMFVCRGLQEEDIAVLDNPRIRTASDRLAILRGIDHAACRVAIVRMLLGSWGNLPDSVLNRAVAEHEMATNWLLAVPGSQRLAAPLQAAVVYAYPINKDLVTSFLEALIGGEDLKKGTAAYAARVYIVEKKQAHSQRERQATFRRTLSALAYHVQNKPLMKLQDGNYGIVFFNKARSKAGLSIVVEPTELS